MKRIGNLIIVTVAVLFLILLIWLTGGPWRFLVENPGQYGFAIDANGLVYVGDTDRIKVFQGNEWIATMPSMPRGYVFTIIDGHTLEVAGGTCYLAELDGIDYANWKKNIYKSWEDHRLTAWRELSKKREFVAVDGARYSLDMIAGGYKIIKHLTDDKIEIILERLG